MSITRVVSLSVAMCILTPAFIAASSAEDTSSTDLSLVDSMENKAIDVDMAVSSEQAVGFSHLDDVFAPLKTDSSLANFSDLNSQGDFIFNPL